jgi:AAA15 family ATPase/GTPase
MLIEFKISNFRSIRDTQKFSMVASTSKDLSQNICLSDFDENLHLIRSAAIYGPNASGKTTLIRALAFMKELVVNSAKESQQGEKIQVESFSFDKEHRTQPSEFEITFSKENICYQYGFIVDENRIIKEWLFAYPGNHQQKWFIRQYDIKMDSYTWSFSRLFKGQKESWKTSTRNNALFLSTAIQLNSDQLNPVFTWFQKDLIVIRDIERPYLNRQNIAQIKTSTGKKLILKYLAVADQSIVDVLLENKEIPEDIFSTLKGMPQEIKDRLKKEGIPKVNFVHPLETIIDFDAESEGTRRLFSLAGLWVDALENDRVLVIDELGNSMHPLLVKFLIGLICSSEINKKNAQLIFSTHDISLLNSEIFRRDQIWFVEKDKNYATQIYPLLDFQTRKQEALAKGYLQGRYGALPYIGEWEL